MRRIFGKKKASAPTPTLGDVSGKVNARTDSLEAKIAKEEKELLVLKKKIARAKGPAKTRLKKRALQILKRKRMFESQRDQLMQQSFVRVPFHSHFLPFSFHHLNACNNICYL